MPTNTCLPIWNARIAIVIQSTTPEIGRLKNPRKFPYEDIMPLRKLVSMIGPSTKPSTIGAAGNSYLLIAHPITAKMRIAQMSKMRLFIANAPMLASTMTIGSRMFFGIFSIFKNNPKPYCCTTNMKMFATIRITNIA